MQLITFITLIAITAAAQLPTANYLPPSNNYLPPNQGGQGGHQGGKPSNNYIPPNHGHGNGGNNQGSGSNTYLPPNQGNGQSGSNQGSGSNTYLPPNQGHGAGGNGNTRPQQEAEKNAVVLQQDQEITEDGFHYSYETSNGIRTEEAGNTEQSEGGFSYQGDDGNTYTVTFTAGEGGFRPQGAHLPVPPPTPAEILLALQQNEKDEAAGIFDDGKYRPDSHGGSSAGTQNGGSSGQSGYGSANHLGSSNSGYRY